MSYGDAVISRADNTVDDEYQRLLLHQSSTVSYNATVWISLVLAAVLVWAMPRPEAVYASVAVVLVPVVGLVFGQIWLMRRIPRPRPNKVSKLEIVAGVVVGALLIWGVARAEATTGLGMITRVTSGAVGAVCGALISVALFVVVWPRLRERDQHRLDRQLDEDSPDSDN